MLSRTLCQDLLSARKLDLGFGVDRCTVAVSFLRPVIVKGFRHPSMAPKGKMVCILNVVCRKVKRDEKSKNISEIFLVAFWKVIQILYEFLALTKYTHQDFTADALSAQGMPVDQAKGIFLFLIAPFLPVQKSLVLQLQNALPRPSFPTCKVVMHAGGDASSEPLLLHPGTFALKRLAKGIALKTKVLASSCWKKFIPLSLACLYISEGTVVGFLHDPL